MPVVIRKVDLARGIYEVVRECLAGLPAQDPDGAMELLIPDIQGFITAAEHTLEEEYKAVSEEET